MQCSSGSAKCDSSMVRIMLCNEHMPIESAHFRDCEYSYASKASCSDRQYLSLCYVSLKSCVCCALQTEECNIARQNVSL